MRNAIRAAKPARSASLSKAMPAAFFALVTGSLLACSAAGGDGAGTAARPAPLRVDAVSTATSAITDPVTDNDGKGADVLIILASSRTNSTAKIADAIARRLNAKVLSPQQVSPDELQKYALIGFGSGIFDQMHHRSLLEIADGLPRVPNRRVFIFSTSGVARRFAVAHGIDDPHTPLRERLQAAGCVVVGEFNCAGFNDNSFLKLFGGMNKGRPNREDIERAEAFADGLHGVVDEQG
jgi:flavodoxin